MIHAWFRLLAFTASLAATTSLQAKEVAFIPSSPHRVLAVVGEGASYYLIEQDKPLLAPCQGPGLLEMSIRRIVTPNEKGVVSASLQMTLDDAVQPPLTFRRARESGVRFVDEPGFFPSAARQARIAIPSGSHLVRLELGHRGVAVAVAIRYKAAPTASNRHPVANAKHGGDELPDLVAIPAEGDELTAAANAKDGNSDAATATSNASSNPQPTPDQTQELVVTKIEQQESVSTPTTKDEAAQLQQTVTKSDKIGLAFGAEFGSAWTYINVGQPSPALQLSLRYELPWLEKQLSIGIELGITRYDVLSDKDTVPNFVANNWVIPSYAVLTYRPHINPWLHLETGLGAGLVLSIANLNYGNAVYDDNLAVGPAALVFAEAGINIGIGALYARLQLDAIWAENKIYDNFNYLGSGVGIGYRVYL